MSIRMALAAAATLVALAFTMSTTERWFSRHRPQDLAWSISLAMFTLASAALWTGTSLGWTGLRFRVFYLFGAILNVPILALGTVFLMGQPRQGRRWSLVVALGAAFAAGVVSVAPLRQAIPIGRLPQGSEVFGALPRLLAATGSIGGTIVVIGGALLSVGRQVRSRGSGRSRTVGANVLIAAGVTVLGAGGLANSLVGEMEAFALSLVVGVALLFLGFLVATASPRAEGVGASSDAKHQELDHSRHENH